MKKIVQYLSFVALVGIVVLACKDNFSEQDFLNSQLKSSSKQDSLNTVKQANALNAAGQLLSYTLQVLDDKTPVSGVAVTMSNPPAGTSGSTLSATTDANGFATFTNVQIGANTFVVSKTGYYSATFIVDFGTIQQGINYTIINNSGGNTSVIPVKKTASNQIPIYPTGSGTSTATIKGQVWIETDLTNSMPEPAPGVTLKANLTNQSGAGIGGNNQTSNGQGTIVNYSFNTGSIGTATTDAQGNYSMTVPASADGRTITLIYPQINANQKVGYTRLNNVQIAPTVNTVASVYGPPSIIGAVYEAVPQVNGVVATFNPASPAPPGQGVKFTFTSIPRAVDVGDLFSYQTTGGFLPNGALSTTSPYAMLLLSNRGTGYTSAPTITFSAPVSGTLPTAKAAMAGTVGMSVTNAGSGYTGAVSFLLQQSSDGTNFYNCKDIGSNNISFSTDVGSTPTGISAVKVPTTGSGFESGKPLLTASNPSGGDFGTTTFRWVITGNGTGAVAAVIPSLYVERVSVLTNNTGSGDPGLYTAPAPPTMTFSGGGATTQAVVSTLEFGTQWSITIDNSNVTQAYKVSPSNSILEFSSYYFGLYSNNNITDAFGNGTITLNSSLTPSVSGLAFFDQTRANRTQAYGSTPPAYSITPSTSAPASAIVNVNSTLGSSSFGTITGLSNISTGSGYDTPLSISIAPVSGLAVQGTSGKIDISSFIKSDLVTRAYTWVGGTYTVTNIGTGYQPYLNMYWSYYQSSVTTNAVQFSGGTSFTVKTGDVITNNVNYGTGNKQLNVN